MVLDFDPAALGGLAGMIALAGWALGRMQGGLPERCAPSPAAPPAADRAAKREAAPPPECQQRAREERSALLAAPVALTELHAEAAAIRRDARIFERETAQAALFALPRSHGDQECRYLGRSGQPTCPQPRACGSCGAVAGAAQLSAAPASLTRV